MKLHYAPASPFVRKVLACAILRGIDGQIETVATDPHASPAHLLKDNPLSKIPALVLEDGTMLPGYVPAATLAGYLLGEAGN